MPVIPVYEKRLTPEMSGGAARVPTDDPVGAAIAQVGGGLQQVGVQLEQQRQKQEEFEEKVRAQNLLLRGSQQFAEQQQQRQQEWNFDGDMRPQFDQDFEKWQRQNLSTFKTARIREFFNGQANQFRAAMGNQINAYQTGQIRQRDYNTFVDDLDRKQSTVYQDPDAIDAAREDFLQSLELNQTLDPATKQALGLSMRNSLAYAYNVGGIEGRPGRDPDAFMREYGPAMAQATGMPWAGVDSKAAFDAAILTESRGQQFAADGTPLTSPAGAVGIAQVMKKTGPEAAALAGLPWDENRWKNDPDYNYAIGRAYFDKQMQDFGGDVEKAWAAYNAGPQALRIAIGKAETQGGTYLDHLPEETQKYVAINRQRLGNVGIQSQQSMQLPPHWDDMTFPQQRELFNKMMAASKARNTEFNTYFDRILSAETAMNRDGQLDPYQDVLTPENFLRRYQNPMEAQLRYEAYQNRRLIPAYSQQIQGLSYPDLLAQKEALTNAPIRQDLNYTESEKDRAARMAALDARIKLFEDNPAYAVSANNPVVRMAETNVATAYRVLQSASEQDGPAATEAFFAAQNNLYTLRRGLQEEAGVYEPRILTNDDRERFKSAYAPLSQTDKAAYLTNYVAGMSPVNARFALKELEDAKVIPGGSWLLANARDENSRSYVLNSLLSKPGDLKSLYGVDAATYGKIDVAVAAKIATYKSVLDLGTQQADNDALAVKETVIRVAVQQYGRTEDVGKAVDTAMETIFPGWQFSDGYSRWRRATGIDYAPTAKLALPPDADMTVDQALDGLGLWWEDKGRHIEFAALPDRSNLRTASEAKIETDRRLPDNVFFITDPDKSGVILVAENALGQRASVLDVRNQPIKVPWQEISDAKMRQAQISTARRIRLSQEGGELPGYETYYPPGYEAESYYLLD